MWISDLGNGRYRNPVLYTDYSDPDVIRVGKDYYMTASSFSNAPGLPVLHSTDLVNWKVINYAVKRIPEFRYRNPIHGCGVWAPSIRYHEGLFYICFPMPDEGIYMTTTKDPYGEWSKPVNIRPGAGWIDPCPFWDDDGRAYLVAGVAKSRIGYKSVLHIVEMRPDGMGLIGEEKKIFDGNENGQITIEGPKMYKRNGYYYIFAPAGGVKAGWQTVLRSKNVYGPYEYRVVMRQGETKTNGPHQGAWIDTVTGQDWFIHFQDVNAAGRITHLQPMHWTGDWPVIGIKEEDNDAGIPVTEYDKPDVGNDKADAEKKIYAPDCDDDFTGDTLGLQWQWNANWEENWFDMTGKGIRLNAVYTTAERKLSDLRNLLLQKWPEPEFTCEAKLNISDMKNGDTAGFISLGMEYAAVIFKKNNDVITAAGVHGIQHFDCDMAFTEENSEECGAIKNSDTVFVKYKVEKIGKRLIHDAYLNVDITCPKEMVTLYYSTDGRNYVKAVSCEAKAGRWVGVKSGPFIKHDNETGNETGSIIVEYVHYT